MNVAVITARGGSKRLPGKNIRLFAGRPMIAYAIDAANASGLFDQIVVSTDDTTIAGVAQDYGASVPFVRPAALSDDYATTVEVMAHAVETFRGYGWDLSGVCCIYPCVPFLRGSDLHRGHDELVRTGAAYVFPIVEFRSSVHRALRQLPDGRMVPLFPANEQTRTQDLDAAFFDPGQFYWGTPDAWSEGLNIHSAGVGVEFSAQRGVDIDNESDWAWAELVFEAMQRLPAKSG